MPTLNDAKQQFIEKISSEISDLKRWKVDLLKQNETTQRIINGIKNKENRINDLYTSLIELELKDAQNDNTQTDKKTEKNNQ